MQSQVAGLPRAGAVPGDRGRSLLPGFLCRRFRYVSLPEASGEVRRAAAASVGAPVIAVVGGLVGLGFLGDGATLAALSGAALRGVGGEAEGYWGAGSPKNPQGPEPSLLCAPHARPCLALKPRSPAPALNSTSCRPARPVPGELPRAHHAR